MTVHRFRNPCHLAVDFSLVCLAFAVQQFIETSVEGKQYVPELDEFSLDFSLDGKICCAPGLPLIKM